MKTRKQEWKMGKKFVSYVGGIFLNIELKHYFINAILLTYLMCKGTNIKWKNWFITEIIISLLNISVYMRHTMLQSYKVRVFFVVAPSTYHSKCHQVKDLNLITQYQITLTSMILPWNGLHRNPCAKTHVLESVRKLNYIQ